MSGTFRDAVLDLARHHEFARRLVNSGRLSIPATYWESPLNTADGEPFEHGPPPGAPAIDAPVLRSGAPDERRWLIDQLGNDFVLLIFDDGEIDLQRRQAELAGLQPAVRLLRIVRRDATGSEGAVIDQWGIAAHRYDGVPGTSYLVRPDQHVAARWRAYQTADIAGALDRALART